MCLSGLQFFHQEGCPIVNNLGCGGCGTVDLHTMLVAVKKPNTAADVRRLEAEHLIMATMDHVSIPRSIAAWQPSDGGGKGIVMRYISGGSLHEQIGAALSSTFSLHCMYGCSSASSL